MNAMEKFQKMLSLTPYQDRTEIPVFPMMLVTYAAMAKGITQADTIRSADKWIEAMQQAWEIIGKPDCAMPMYPGDTVFIMGLPARVPGKELGENELYQFVETPFFEDQEEYKKIMAMGWQAWQGVGGQTGI